MTGFFLFLFQTESKTTGKLKCPKLIDFKKFPNFADKFKAVSGSQYFLDMGSLNAVFIKFGFN